METTAISTATASVNAARTAPSSVISSDFEMFLKMLTTQMTNQDPLNPIESSDYAVQLATFSGVEQQVLTNDLLAQLGTQMSVSGLAQMAGWVGKEARAAVPAYFDGAPLTIAPNPAAIADRVELVVTDASGREVRREALPVSADPIEWVGTDDAGNPLPAGVYSFEVVSYSGSDELLREPAEVYSQIEEVRSEGGETILIFAGGQAVVASQVTALRDPTLRVR